MLHIGTDGRARLEPFGWKLDPALLTLDTEATLGTALDVADRPSEPAIDRIVASSGAPVPKEAVSQGEGSGPRLLLLGRVEVQGARGEGIHHRLARATELVAYLMLHPGASRHEVEEALWAGRRIEPATRRQLISRTRAWLGTNADGEPYLESMLSGVGDTVKLRPDVTSDWHDFQQLAGRGLAAGEQGLADLESALTLVRGRPFVGIDPRRYAWAESHIQAMVSLVVDVSTTLATRLLRAGEPRLACDVAVKGLRTDSTNEHLVRLAISSSVSSGRAGLAVRLRDQFLRELEEVHGEVDVAEETSQVLSLVRQ